MEIVHVHIYDPARSIFKGSEKDRAECQTVHCECPEKCGLFARGECSFIAAFGWMKCPYGHYKKEEGFTKRAGKYHAWIEEKKKKYDGIATLKSHTNKIAFVGEHVFLPYAHITMNESVPFLGKSGPFITGNCFLLKTSFDMNSIISMIKFKPHALFGGEITSYQKEVVPKFIMHLKECIPDVFDKLPQEIKDKINSFSNVGRKAYLHSLKPGTIIRKDGEIWRWDGTHLESNNAKYLFSVVKYEEIRIIIKPKEDETIKITNDDQVDKDTVYED